MKRSEIIGILSLIVFSFFLTDFVTDIAINNNRLMKTIRESSSEYEISSVSAIIEDNTIIPGIKGKSVNEIDSYLKMKDFGIFNKNYLIYETINPEISIEDNKDKVIISGNKIKRNISILIDDNYDVIKYCNNNNIKYTKLVKNDDKLLNKDNINIESDINKFNDLKTILNKKKLNNNICLINYSNIKECIKNNYYLVKYSLEINNSNINKNMLNINNGEIIYVNNNLSVENFVILLKYIKSKDLKNIYLNDLIKE